MDTPVVEVRIWGKTVGAVAPDPRLGCYVFAYDAAWKRGVVELAPLTMPLTGSGNATFAFPSLSEASFMRLPGLLADSLPDDFGNALIDAWMSSKGVAKHAITTLDRLAYMGKRGMGALQYRPAKGAHRESSEPLQMKALVEAARQVLGGDISGDAFAQAALANIIRVGTSAGGARAKAVVSWNPATHEIRSGQFDVSPGFEHWLLKFDGVGSDRELGTGADYGRVEYAYYLMAKAAGILMTDCRLLEETGRAHFMTRRFDRDVNQRHHIQSLCAMDHLDYKQRATHAYGQLFMVISRLKLGDEAMAQAYRRMAFNVMARNCDDHTKNFAFRLKQGGVWEIAPAYDVTHAYNPAGEWTYQHLMSVNGKFADIGRDDLLVEADRYGVRLPLDILADVRSALENWSGFAREAGLGATLAQRIRGDFQPV